MFGRLVLELEFVTKPLDLIVSTRSDGGWDEAFFTGTGFPGDFYIHRHRPERPTRAEP